MRRNCKKDRRSRSVLAIITAALIITGCSPALAGTAVETGTAETMAQSSGNVTWFDGSQIRQAQVTISGLSDLSVLSFTPDLTLIPVTETSQVKCIKITSMEDIQGLYDMQLLDMNKEPIFNVRTLYDGGIYPLGNDWYGVVLPNGYAETCLLRIGNTYFEVK